MNRKDFIKQSAFAAGALYSLGLQGAPKKTEKIQFNMASISNPNTKNICKTCGTRYNNDTFNINTCQVCSDERQYIKDYGQKWLSYNDLSKDYTIKINERSGELYELQVFPKFAIAQRAFFIKTTRGNILWDCLPFIDQPTVEFIKSNGGLDAIAISHPHYYSLMNEWAKAFNCPVYIHKSDHEWVMDNKTHIIFWEGEQKVLNQEATLFHIGGHFPGSAVLQCSLPAYEKTLFVGDTLYLSPDKKHLSAMFSYPNIIPLSHQQTLDVFNKVDQISFKTLFGAFAHQNLENNAKHVFQNSFNIYKNLR